MRIELKYTDRKSRTREKNNNCLHYMQIRFEKKRKKIGPAAARAKSFESEKKFKTTSQMKKKEKKKKVPVRPFLYSR